KGRQRAFTGFADGLVELRFRGRNFGEGLNLLLLAFALGSGQLLGQDVARLRVLLLIDLFFEVVQFRLLGLGGGDLLPLVRRGGFGRKVFGGWGLLEAGALL